MTKRGTRPGDAWLRELERWAGFMLEQMPAMSVEQMMEALRILRDVEIRVMNPKE